MPRPIAGRWAAPARRPLRTDDGRRLYLGHAYSKGGMILVPDAEEMADAFEALGLNPEAIMMRGRPTALARLLADYFAYRANVLMNFVEPRLMNAQQAKALFKQYRKQLCPNGVGP